MLTVEHQSAEGVIKINCKPLDQTELKKFDKNEKGLVINLTSVTKDIRTQLNEQLRCLDTRLECQQSQLLEIQDVFKRRAEIELNYSRDLEKLSKLLTSRHKEQKLKREGWNALSSTAIWRQLVDEIRKAGKDHGAMAEIYNANITSRCSDIHEDINRMYKKCREITFEIHEEILKVLHELHTAMKTNHTYQSEFRQAESKLAVVEKQRSKLKEQIPAEKLAKSRKFRLIEKELDKRKRKYTEARLKATRARNEYLLCMEAGNASLHKYYVDDLSDMLDCMDYGLHQSLARAVLARSDAIKQLRKSEQMDVDSMEKIITSLDSRLDKKMFLEKNEAAFMIPKKFEYQPVRRDETELVQKAVVDELKSRKLKLAERINSLRVESEEIWKSLEAAEKSLNEMVSNPDYDTTRYFVEEESARAERAERENQTLQDRKDQRQETEHFYLQKFREYILNSNRLARLQAKYEHIRQTVGDQSGSAVTGLTLPRPISNTRKRIGRTLIGGQPKLFGGSLEEYLESSHQDIPQIIKSCVRIINLYGLHHQGIFRVSGSQAEINNFRESFERGEDPLADMTDGNDINSVAGVLKLYLRELREPIFSVQYFDQFMELAKLESKHEFVVKVRELVKSWPRPVYIVMRYLFAFLQHLSTYSDENMMDPYNLAICFGPTLVPIPTDRDQVIYQNLVNELIKNFIIFNEDIFPSDGTGTVYEKYISCEPDIIGDYDTDTAMVQEDAEDDDDEHDDAMDDDSVFKGDDRDGIKDISIDCFGQSEVLEAIAQYDFTARSSREVSFMKGDSIVLYSQASSDWWRGCVGGREGLIPDKYILIKIRGEDDPRDSMSSMSETGSEPRRRISSQSDTLRSSRSEHQSPRVSRPSHHSISAPPETPPLVRATPQRHSVTSTAPVTVISVTSPTVTSSHDSLDQDSGNPESELTTTTSERGASRSPSDYRSLDCDSLSVDDTSDDNTGPGPGGATVIHLTGDTIPNIDDDEDDLISTRRTLQTEGSSGPESGQKIENSSSQDSLERLRAELETDLACVRAVVEEVVTAGGDQLLDTAELASLPAGSRHGVGRQLSGPEENRTVSPVSVGRKSPTGVISARKVSPTPLVQERKLSPSSMGERTKSPVTATDRKVFQTESVQRKMSSVSIDTPERRISSSSSPPVPEQRQSLIADNVELGARPRQAAAAVTPTAVTPAARKLSEHQDTSSSNVLLKQSSWGSSRWGPGGPGARKSSETPTPSSDTPTVANVTTSSSGNSFLRRKDLWERRSMSNPGEDKPESRGWQSKTTPRVSKTSNNTPDLVMDLPTGPMASSPPIPAPRPIQRSRSPSTDSVSSSDTAPEPARVGESPSRHTTADNFAAGDSDTMRKHGGSKTLDGKSSSSTTTSPLPVFRTNILASSTPSSAASLTPSFRTPSQVSATKTLFSSPGPGVTPKPAVKVKPILQVKPSEIKKDSNAKE